MISVFHRAARKAAEQNEGHLAKTIGDVVLLEFGEPRQAVDAARLLAASFGDACRPLGLPPARLRTGIDVGEVARRGDDLVGGALNLASRLQSIAAVQNALSYSWRKKPDSDCRGSASLSTPSMRWTNGVAHSGSSAMRRVR